MMTVKACSEAEFLESGLTKILTVCNFENALAMAIIFPFKIFKI